MLSLNYIFLLSFSMYNPMKNSCQSITCMQFIAMQAGCWISNPLPNEQNADAQADPGARKHGFARGLYEIYDEQGIALIASYLRLYFWKPGLHDGLIIPDHGFIFKQNCGNVTLQQFFNASNVCLNCSCFAGSALSSV